MPFETIDKPAATALPVRPNISDYEAQRESFRWEEIAKELDGLPGGGINIAYEAIDRHVAKGRGAKPAILWEGKNGEQETYTFEDMARLSNRWCDVLRKLGIKKGDRV
ncbi:MAG TPA: acetate--CoA ligase, partial [Dehalococcoidia bacterium]